MSFVTQLEQALLVIAKTAVPALTTELGEHDHDQITPGSFPFAYTRGFLRTQADSDSGTVTTYAGELVVVVTGEDLAGLEEVRDVAEAIAAAISADGTLGGLVTSTLVGIDSYEDASGSRQVASLTLEMDGSAASGGATAEGAISWQLEAEVLLVSTTVAAWEADRAAAIVTALGAGAARFDSDLFDPPAEAVPDGAARFALSLTADVGILGSNTVGTVIGISLRVFHRLAVGATERSYTMATMLAQMLALAEREFWTGPFPDARITDDGDPEISELAR